MVTVSQSKPVGVGIPARKRREIEDWEEMISIVDNSFILVKPHSNHVFL
jgi:hypothetical protein